MLIEEVKKDYPLVYDRIIYYTNKDEGTILSSFGWASSAEGSAFWSAMNKRNITKAKELQPHLFEDIPIIGNIYVSGNYIHDIVSNKPYKHNNTAIRIKSKIFYNKDSVLPLSNKKPGRLANQEEIDWFNACVKAGKFVEKPTSKKKVEFKVGDTVRCIDKGKKGAGWKKDLVFKIESLTNIVEGECIVWVESSNKGVYTSSLEFVSENTFEPKVGDYYKAMVDAPNGGVVKQHEIGRIYEISPKYICLCFPYHENYKVKKLSLQNTNLYTKVNPDELVSEKTIDYKISSDEAFMKPIIVKKYKNKKSKLLIK